MLVYPNITKSGKEITKDSYIVLLPDVIESLLKINKKLHITLLLPTNVKRDVRIRELFKDKRYKSSIDFKPFDVPSSNNSMRTSFFFNSQTFLDAIDYRKNDYDIVYSHLPEHTLGLSNLFNNATQSRPKFIGYCHWFETSKSVGFTKTMLLQNFAGILEMEQCGVNSKWLKDYVLKEAKRWFNDDIINQLDTIIQPHQLGIDSIDFQTKIPKKKTILFNHRKGTYTGFTDFCKAMEKLWKKRKDFEVITTFDECDISKYKWNGGKWGSPNREVYLNTLKEKVYVGVGYFKNYSAWSLSAMDGLSRGVPYILPDKLCYDEMVGDDYPLMYKHKKEDDFLRVLEMVLDEPKIRTEAVKKITPKIKKMKWLPQIKRWMDWDDLFNPHNFAMVAETPKYKEMVKIIKNHKRISRYELITKKNWGPQIPVGRYRNRLRLDKRVKFLKDGYEWVG